MKFLDLERCCLIDTYEILDLEQTKVCFWDFFVFYLFIYLCIIKVVFFLRFIVRRPKKTQTFPFSFSENISDYTVKKKKTLPVSLRLWNNQLRKSNQGHAVKFSVNTFSRIFHRVFLRCWRLNILFLFCAPLVVVSPRWSAAKLVIIWGAGGLILCEGCTLAAALRASTEGRGIEKDIRLIMSDRRNRVSVL